jgi:hypothetical protein
MKRLTLAQQRLRAKKMAEINSKIKAARGGYESEPLEKSYKDAKPITDISGITRNSRISYNNPLLIDVDY